MSSGAFAKLLIGFQTDISTIATEGFILFVNTSGLNYSKNQILPQTIRGNLNPVEPSDGNKNVAGQIVVPVDSIAFYYLLKAAFGDATQTGSGPYTHTFKLGNTRPYLTFEVQYTDLDTVKYFQYTGCKINGIQIKGGEDAELLATFDVVGAERSVENTSFHAAASTLSFSRLKNNQLTMKEGGSTISNATLVDLNINFNCDTSKFVIGGGGVLGTIPDGVASVSGNLETLLDDTTLIDKADDADESSLELTFSGGSTSQLILTLPEIKYTPNDPGIPGPQGLAVSLPFAGYYENASEATSFQAELVNSVDHS